MKPLSLVVAVLAACAAPALTLAHPPEKTLASQTFDLNINGTQIGAEFGYQLALPGDVDGDGFEDLLVGAPLSDFGGTTDAGAAYLFPGTANGFGGVPIWQVQAEQLNGQYGSSVAGIGDVNGDGFMDFAIGAQFYDNGHTDEGVVFVYLGGTNVPITSNTFLEVNQASAFLGTTVAGAGDMNGDGFADLIAGAPGHDNAGATNGGLAGVWFGAPGGLFNNVRDVTFSSSQTNARLGSDVAGVGDFNADGFADVLVGSPDYTSGQTEEGAAFLYLGSSTVDIGTDGHFQIDQAGADFGRSVDGAGDVNGDGYSDLIVGAPFYDDGETDEGGAFVYHGGPTVDLATDFIRTSNQANANLGAQVAGLGDTNGDGFADIAAAAPLFDGTGADSGLVLVFSGSTVGVTTSSMLSLNFPEAGAEMGSAIGGGDANNDGLTELVAGARRSNAGGLNDSGRVSIARGGPVLPDATPELTIESNTANANMGAAVATGDLNGDGFVDMAIGSYRQNGPNLQAGVTHVHFGSASGLSVTPNATVSSNIIGAQFGHAVAIGDANGDGFGDLISGAPKQGSGETGEGLVFIHFGGAGAFDTTVDRTLQVNQATAEFGYSVAFAGDVNGDGFGDVVVGAPFYDNGSTDEGAMFLFLGSPNFDTQADAMVEMNQGSGFVGRSVAGIGDLNGDGFGDIAAGANGFDVEMGNDGAAFVWFGSRTFDTTVDRQYLGDQLDGRMGASLAGVGDVNGDGFDDFAVGANEQDASLGNSGAVFVFLGDTNPNTARHATLSSQQATSGDGESVAAAGDVNLDGYADILVGAANHDFNNLVQSGAAFLYLGGPGTFNTTHDLVLARNAAGDQLGKSVISGDFDGDGDSDLVVGGWSFDGGQSDEGAVFVYQNRDVGRLSSPQSFSVIPLATVEQWGASRTADSFVVAMESASTLGRERGKLEIETCPSGKAFGAPECVRFQSPSWTDLNAVSGPVGLGAQATGLALDSLQHWRVRTLYAPATVGLGGSAEPIGPRVGPWRRMHAESGLGDIRISALLMKDSLE